MSQQTVNYGATQVAEPPAPFLPESDAAAAGDDNRRKLLVAGAVAGVVVLVLAAFFLLKGGGSAAKSDSFVVTHHPAKSAPAAAAAPVKLPKHVAAPVGRDPFKALYTPPVAAVAGAAPTTTQPAPGGTTTTTASGSTPTTSTGSATSTTTTSTAYHAVWVKLKAITSTTASFDVGLSNNKSLKVVHYSSVQALHMFASNFELLSVRNGTASVRYGDGSPFSLTLAHPTMIVG